MPSQTTSDDLLERHFADPDDEDALRVWADALLEEGDPRGEWIQLSLSPDSEERTRKRATMEKRLGGKLVGPARLFLREWSFDEHGLVDRVRCEAEKLVEGFDEIRMLNPKLSVALTSMKSRALIKFLKVLPLGEIYHLDFTGAVMGRQACNVPDRTLEDLIPALRSVRHLGLAVNSNPKLVFRPETLRRLGDALERIELLSFVYDRFSYGEQLAPVEAYAAAIAEGAGFANLKVLFARGADPQLFAALPNLVTLVTEPSYSNEGPSNAAECEALKRARA